MSSPTDLLVRQLDERTAVDGEQWDLYRTRDGRFIVKMWAGPDDAAARTVESTSLACALSAAIESKRLPVIPRRPAPVDAGRTEIARQGGSYPWRAEVDGASLGGHKTKRDAQAAVDRYVARVNEAIAEWDAKHASTAAGVEGVDFRYEGGPR